MRRRDFLAAAAAVATLPCAGPVRAAGAQVALVGGVLIDGYGGEPIADSVVLIDGARIAAVGTLATLPVPDGAETVSTEGCSVLPGLWDMNVHLSRLGHADRTHWDESYLPLAQRVVMPLAMADLLRAGVTSVRDVASPLEASLAMRERTASGLSPGPGVYVGGPALAAIADPRARPYRLAVSGAADARARVAQILRAGADYIVVRDCYAMDAADLAAIVAAAHSAGSTVHAEITTDQDLAPALGAGVDGLIGIGDGGGPWPAPALAALAARGAAGRPLVVASTLSPLVNATWIARNHEPLDDPRVHEGWPPVVADDVRGSIDDLARLGAVYPNSEWRRGGYATRIGALIEAGAQVVAGSGAGDEAHLPYRATWQEIEALVREAGLAPMEAIRRATYWPSVACGEQHQSGTLTTGKYADLLVVRGDVLRHIDRLAEPAIVYRHGRRVV